MFLQLNTCRIRALSADQTVISCKCLRRCSTLWTLNKFQWRWETNLTIRQFNSSYSSHGIEAGMGLRKHLNRAIYTKYTFICWIFGGNFGWRKPIIIIFFYLFESIYIQICLHVRLNYKLNSVIILHNF